MFALKYDPRMPAIQTIQAKHWRAMNAQDQHLADVFKQPPLVAYRRQRKLQDISIKAKVPPAIQRYQNRELKGMSKCGKPCSACPSVKTGREVRITQNETWKINRKVNCDTFNCVYLIHCEKCGKNYIGETGRLLKNRLSDHRG